MGIDGCFTQKPIILWSHPRSVSTAFERAFLERSNEFECFHEPFGDAYYFGPERISKRYAGNMPKDSELINCTYGKIQEKLFKPRKSGKRVFAKDMAYAVCPYYRDSNFEPFKDAINTFIIRNPKNAIPSLYKLSNSKATGWGYFDPCEAGYAELKELVDFTKSVFREPIVMVNAEDLISSPSEVLQKYCTMVGIEFTESMLNWKTNSLQLFNKWKGWHDAAVKSNGFITAPKATDAEPTELPKVVQQAIEDNMPVYEYLNSLCMKV